MREETIRKAKTIVSADNSITYPSIASSNYVRCVMRDLIALTENEELQSDEEICDLCLGAGTCPNCNGTGKLPVDEKEEST
jgi:hypothetical protein